MKRLRLLVDPSRGSARIALLVVDVVLLAALVSGYQEYGATFAFVFPGVRETLRLTVLSFAVAFILGLVAALAMISKNCILNSVATFYVRVVRGIPLLVTLLYVGVIAIPLLSNWLGIGRIEGFTRAVIALALASGAYHAEIIRGGIQAIERGQFEAASAIGMGYSQTMRFVIMPQVFRIILPSLANEFIVTLKDTALASALAVIELTRLGHLNVSRTRDTFTTWNTVTLLYLAMTLTLSFGAEKLRKRHGN